VPEGGEVLVAALGLELGGGPAAGGQVPERAVVQRGGLLEQVLRAGIGQATAPAGGVDVGQRPGALSRGWRAPAGQEHRPGGAAGQQPGQEPGGGGGPVQVLGVAALAAGAGPPEFGVEITDVQGEDLLGCALIDR
jgi:hypothetical protein